MNSKLYDVNQKIFQSLADFESRTIIFQIVNEAKSGEEIAFQTGIPQSTVYKKLRDLEALGLVFVEQQDTTPAGRTMNFYRSKIKEATINVKSLEPKFILIPTK